MSKALKIVLVVALAAVAVVLLFTVVFPWVDTILADPTMGLGPPG